ncbi:hypothetical protein [Streptomyces sp. NPDC127197]|uniref:hypothetical protein n=1 Tax=Streptomyces sp. NPDC127197 TaxID=3345388 RepID=UPI0036373EC4
MVPTQHPRHPEYEGTYDRDDFKHWNAGANPDDGCDTREELLIAEAVKGPERGDGCRLSGGEWLSYYDEVSVTDPSALDVDPAWAAFTAPQVAQQIRDQRRAAALRRLLGSQEAVAEADAAYEAALRRRSWGVERAADEAADAAGHRTAEFLLRRRLGELHAARQRRAAARTAADGVLVDAA